MNIILCGLPGSGKTTVGELLAKELQATFIDVDHLIGRGFTCREIFANQGEEHFRKLENQTIRTLAQKPLKNTILSVGGGALETPETIEWLKKIGILVYLDGEVEELFERITKEGFPPYLDPKNPFPSFKKLAEKRTPAYLTHANCSIRGHNLAPEEIAKKALHTLPFEGLLRSSHFINQLQSIRASLYVIITDTTVEPLHGKPLADFLQKQGLNVSLIAFPAGEENKSRESKELCENHLLALGAGRDTCVIGVGGGVVTDLAGFVASTYCRGVPFVLAPTSLLAMVDASIGGKTGINVPEGKNLIGTISQPHSVYIDPSTLKTLPLSEIKNGTVEMIKHGLIADKNYFRFLKSHAEDLFPVMERAIYESVAIKTNIVEEDTFEKGKRRLLNFGHTIGHAIEAATDYRIPHGEAVAIGIVAESYLSMEMGYLNRSDFETIYEMFNDHKVSLSPDQLRKGMQMDKKSIRKTPRFVILQEIGKPLTFDGQYCTEVDEMLLKKTLEWMCNG